MSNESYWVRPLESSVIELSVKTCREHVRFSPSLCFPLKLQHPEPSSHPRQWCDTEDRQQCWGPSQKREGAWDTDDTAEPPTACLSWNPFVMARCVYMGRKRFVCVECVWFVSMCGMCVRCMVSECVWYVWAVCVWEACEMCVTAYAWGVCDVCERGMCVYKGFVWRRCEGMRCECVCVGGCLKGCVRRYVSLWVQVL